MFEWHGWATIRAGAASDDDDAVDAAQRRAEAEVRAMVETFAGDRNEVFDLRNANGELHLWLAGNHNHRHEPAINFFRAVAVAVAVAVAAPGSYGVLHALDHNFITQPWQRWVMLRGRVTREVESALTPHLGRVEDVDLR
ncbi:Imm7 family immunity protein [Jatrophihabitans sp. YIM 134969]